MEYYIFWRIYVEKQYSEIAAQFHNLLTQFSADSHTSTNPSFVLSDTAFKWCFLYPIMLLTCCQLTLLNATCSFQRLLFQPFVAHVPTFFSLDVLLSNIRWSNIFLEIVKCDFQHLKFSMRFTIIDFCFCWYFTWLPDFFPELKLRKFAMGAMGLISVCQYVVASTKCWFNWERSVRKLGRCPNGIHLTWRVLPNLIQQCTGDF